MKRVLKPKTETNQNSALNQARALYYDFFAGFFVFELLDSRKSLFEKQIDILATSPIDSADLTTFSALKRYILQTDLDSIKREYSQTFDIPFAKNSVKFADSNMDCHNSTQGVESRNDEKGVDCFGDSCESPRNDESIENANSSIVSEKSGLCSHERGNKTRASIDEASGKLHDLSPQDEFGGQIFLYLSHYNEGCLNGASLLKAKQIVKQTRFRLNKDGFKESEEHFGFLLLFMRYLLSDLNGDSGDLSESLGESISANVVFNELLRDMASKIADLLSYRDDLPCYQKVGVLLKSFIKLEEEICAI